MHTCVYFNTILTTAYRKLKTEQSNFASICKILPVSGQQLYLGICVLEVVCMPGFFFDLWCCFISIISELTVCFRNHASSSLLFKGTPSSEAPNFVATQLFWVWSDFQSFHRDPKGSAPARCWGVIFSSPRASASKSSLPVGTKPLRVPPQHLVLRGNYVLLKCCLGSGLTLSNLV